jgi:hypothetical protein
VQGKEAGQRVVSIFPAPDGDNLRIFAHNGHERHQIRRDVRGPKALLVPRQQITRQPQAQHEHHQHQPQPVVHLPRLAIGPIPHHLQQVQGHHHDHRLGHEVVNPAQEPPPGHLVLDVPHAFVSRLAAGAVGHPQEQTGDRLCQEGKHEHAARDIAEAGAAGDVFVQGLVRRMAEPRAVVEPIEEGSKHGGSAGESKSE